MRDFYLDLSKEVPIPDDNDPEVLAAIEGGLKDSEEGRLYTREQVEEMIVKWRTKSAIPTRS